MMREKRRKQSERQVARTSGHAQTNTQAIPVDAASQVPAPVRALFPEWPDSRPGPLVTEPPPGMRSVNALRPEQVAEIGYNQSSGEPMKKPD